MSFKELTSAIIMLNLILVTLQLFVDFEAKTMILHIRGIIFSIYLLFAYHAVLNDNI